MHDGVTVSHLQTIYIKSPSPTVIFSGTFSTNESPIYLKQGVHIIIMLMVTFKFNSQM